MQLSRQLKQTVRTVRHLRLPNRAANRLNNARTYCAGVQGMRLWCPPITRPKIMGTAVLGLGYFDFAPADFSPLELFDSKAMSEFILGDLLGWGGCGNVWLVTDKDGKRYALKACPIEADEFDIRMREVDVMKRSQGADNVVQIHDAWVEPMTPELEKTFVPEDSPVYQYATTQYMLFIKTELCDTTLRDWLRSDDRRASQLWRVFRQVTEGLQDLHDRNVMHRDIKPENIFLNIDKSTNTVHAKLGDLGLAKVNGIVHRAMERLPFDSDFQPYATSKVGTFAYMAPEQRRSRYNNKVDIYALGMLLWEMNVQEEDHETRHLALMRTRRTGKAGWCNLKTPESSSFIERLIQPDPTNRPTASEVLAYLDSAEL